MSRPAAGARARRAPTLAEMRGFALERLAEVRGFGGLSRFHAANKYLIMAHSPRHLGVLGNIAANRAGLGAREAAAAYGAALAEALSRAPTAGTHLNAMQHALGHLTRGMPAAGRREALAAVRGFEAGRVPLGSALRVIADCARRQERAYLTGQTYFLLFADPRGPGLPATRPAG